MILYTPSSNPSYAAEATAYAPALSDSTILTPDRFTTGVRRWLVFVAAMVLVSVPVFIQAPLVRYFPWISLGLTPVLILLAMRLLRRPTTHLWGDLLLGFTWTWLSGSIYWGWFRWEPFLHLPIEAIGLPFALWGITRQMGKIGNFFYLGSLFGTVVTDLYFYIVKLIPHWRSLMQVEAEAVQPVFQSALAQINTPWGVSWAIVLALLLLVVTILPLRHHQLHWWAFSGAVMSTILVDSLFWLAAVMA